MNKHALRSVAVTLGALWLALGLAMVPPAVAADTFTPVYHPEMEVSPVSGAIHIDGRLNDAGWQGAACAANFSEHSPGDQVEPPVATKAYMAYDDDYLYVAFVCYDDPSKVRASFTERDRIWSDDYVILCLDTYADQAWAYEIASNPYGIQGDLFWSANGGEDLGYDLVYYAAGQVTTEGYQVELAIPFASLRFPNDSDQAWRVDFWRNHPREVRGQYSWAAYDRDDPCWPCQWGTVAGLTDVSPGKGLELLPALVGIQSSCREPALELDTGELQPGRFLSEDIDADLSLGAKYDVSSAVSAEGAFNPDFSQVESDADQIDVNTTFALQFPEKRPFFQEGSDMFNTYFNVVYTRSINDPRFATKLIGRPGRSNVAFLSAQDEHTPYIVPFAERSEFVAAGRSYSNILRVQQSLGEQSHLGMIATDRRLDGGGSGTVVGADGRVRLSQNYQIEWQALATHTDEPDAPKLTNHFEAVDFDKGEHTAAFDGESFWGHGLYASLERSARHWSFDLDYWERSPTFRTESGFEGVNDERFGNLNTDYTIWFEDSMVEWIDPSVNVARKWHFDGTRKDEWVNLNLSTRLKWAQTNLHTQYLRSNELFQGIQFDDIWAWHMCCQTAPADFLRGGFSLNYGHRIARWDLVMGKESRYYVWADIKPIDRLLLENTLDFTHSNAVDTGERLYDGYIARSKLTFQITRELSTRLVVQYNDFSERWEIDPLITYRLNPFSIFYIGSTRDYENLSVNEHGIDGWRLTDRQYFMKLQYLWQL